MLNDRLTYAKIDLNNITYNVNEIIKKYNDYDYYIGVVKADCYGHGDIKSVEAIIKGGCNYLAVATLDEALFIRKHIIDIPILLLGIIEIKNLKLAIDNNITLTITSTSYLLELIEANPNNLKAHLKINTGANRLGISNNEEIKNAIKLIEESPIYLEGIFTHIYNADNKQDTIKQFDLFEKLTKEIDLMKIPIRHIQASDALYGYDKPKITNGCRLGIIMYGLINTDLNLKSTFSVYSEVIQIHHLKKGENVGYEGIYQAPNDEIIAVVDIGYADGIIRKNSGRTVYINNKEFPIVGRICMDLLFIRIDETVKYHDTVTIIKDNNHIKQIANHLETIPYEVICSIGKRVPRIY